MVQGNTTVDELLKKGYDIVIDHGTAFRMHLLHRTCPACGAAYLIGSDDIVNCTECDYEK